MRTFLFLFFILSGQMSWAQSLGDRSRTIRSRAMGGVAIPFASGAESIFFNPAGLGKSPLLDIKLLDLSVGANSYLTTHLSDFQNIDVNDPSTLNAFYGKQLWVQADGKIAVSVPRFAMGYLSNIEVMAELHNPAFPQFETYFRKDDAVYMGTGFPIGPGSYFGMSLKRISRWGGDTQELGVDTISNSSNLQDIGNSFQNKGQGYGLDIGFLSEFDAPILKPSLALVWQDVGSTAFKITDGADNPPHISQNLTFGAGVGMDLPGLDWQAGMEMRNLLDSEIEIGKKLYLGTEVSLPLIDLRAGYSQGYLSYGVGVNILFFHLDAVSYTEETGLFPGQAGDARYMVSLGFDLSFDANFNFTDNTGKKRKLKQRR